MRTTFCLLATGLAVSLGAREAAAQMREFITREAGPYFRASAGVSLAENGQVTEFTPGPTGGDVEYDVGFNINMAIGYGFNRYFGLEFEFGGSGNEINKAKGFSVHDTFLYNAPFLANVVVQYPIPRTIITPYLGGGGGCTITAFDTDGFSNGPVTLFGSDSDVVYAWQVFAGVRFDLNENMSIGAGYKYFVTGDSSYSYESISTPSAPDIHLGLQGVHSHMITVVFNMKF